MYENCLVINVEKTLDMEKTLKSFGYEKRSGSAAHTINTICIVPKKKWYWESNESVGLSTKSL